MNQSNTPALNRSIPEIEFAQAAPGKSVDVDHKALEVACIDLLSKLEILLAKAVDLDRTDFIDDSANVANGIIDQREKFAGEFLTEDAAAQTQEENSRARSYSQNYESVLKTRPLGNAIFRVFRKTEEVQQITTAHKKLGDALVRACAVTLYHAVALIGLDNAFGQEIDQSSVVFVDQMTNSWK